MKSNHYVPDKQFRERDRFTTHLFSLWLGEKSVHRFVGARGHGSTLRTRK